MRTRIALWVGIIFGLMGCVLLMISDLDQSEPWANFLGLLSVGLGVGAVLAFIDSAVIRRRSLLAIRRHSLLKALARTLIVSLLQTIILAGIVIFASGGDDHVEHLIASALLPMWIVGAVSYGAFVSFPVS